MLCVSFDRSYQFGVASTIDLIKGIMHCLMSFTLGWVENNHRVLSDPEFRALTLPNPPCPQRKRPQAQCVHRRWENQWSPLFEKLICFVFFFPLYAFFSIQIDSHTWFASISIFHKCSIDACGINMKITYQLYARDHSQEGEMSPKKKKKKAKERVGLLCGKLSGN